MSSLWKATVFVFMAAIFSAGCAHTHSLGPVHIFSRSDQHIEIELRSFSVSPDHLVILHDYSPRSLRLINTADTWHNFTLINSEKNVMVSKNLDPLESVTLSLNYLDKGNYIFYCNRFLHRRLGMEGMLMID